MNSTISFAPVKTEHFHILVKWLNEPHVQRWFSRDKPRTITYQGVEKYLGPLILETNNNAVDCYIIQVNKDPIGFIQKSNARLYPREGYDISIANKHIGTITSLAALDLYIGEPSYLNKGYGTGAVIKFLEDYIKPNYNGCIVDPEIDNIASISCFEKAGFKVAMTLDLADNNSVNKAFMIYNSAIK